MNAVVECARDDGAFARSAGAISATIRQAYALAKRGVKDGFIGRDAESVAGGRERDLVFNGHFGFGFLFSILTRSYEKSKEHSHCGIR